MNKEEAELFLVSVRAMRKHMYTIEGVAKDIIPWTEISEAKYLLKIWEEEAEEEVEKAKADKDGWHDPDGKRFLT